MLRFLLLATCLAVCSLPCTGLNPQKRFTQYTHRIWTQADGLPQDTVRAIAQTRDGYLWIGTDEGLARFDGYRSVIFRRSQFSRSSRSRIVRRRRLQRCSAELCILIERVRLTMKLAWRYSLSAVMLSTVLIPVDAQVPAVPAWAQPGSATHVQVAPPPDFHRPSKNFDTPIGIFEGQSDIGSALVPGSASYDPSTNQYTINSAGYNIWYTRDEFRFLWKKMSGDVSLAADIAYPDPNGYSDRKAVLVIRQDLDDDSKEAIAAVHGLGMIHLAERPEKGVRVKDMEYRIGGRGRPGGASPDSLVVVVAKRIGIEKRGDSFALFVSVEGEPMHQFGPPINLHLAGPFYVGIGFCSHLPDKSDTAVLSNVVLENSSGKVH